MKFLLFGLLALLIVGLYLYNEKRRAARLETIASMLGMAFTAGQQLMPAELEQADFYLFTQGDRQIRNLLQGSLEGFNVAEFAYFYTAALGMAGRRDLPNSNDDGQIENRGQTVIWLSQSGRSLPEFDLCPRGGSIRAVTQQTGYQSVGFDGRNDFRAQYQLLGYDAAQLRQVFDNSMLDELLALPTPFTIESRGQHWLLYREAVLVQPQDIPAMLQQAIRLIRSLLNRVTT